MGMTATQVQDGGDCHTSARWGYIKMRVQC